MATKPGKTTIDRLLGREPKAPHLDVALQTAMVVMAAGALSAIVKQRAREAAEQPLLPLVCRRCCLPGGIFEGADCGCSCEAPIPASSMGTAAFITGARSQLDGLAKLSPGERVECARALGIMLRRAFPEIPEAADALDGFGS